MTHMRRIIAAAALAVTLTACYPIHPTVNQCRQEQYPPYCGCPKPGGGVYTTGCITPPVRR